MLGPVDKQAPVEGVEYWILHADIQYMVWVSRALLDATQNMARKFYILIVIGTNHAQERPSCRVAGARGGGAVAEIPANTPQMPRLYS